MNIIKLLFVLLLTISIQLSAAELVSLHGNPVQGGILICKADESVEKLFLDYIEIPIFENTAILGFDRDAKLRHILTLVMKNGDMETTEFYLTKKEYETQRIDNIPPEYLEDPTDPDILNRIEREYSTLLEVRKNIHNNQFIYLDDFTIPVENGEVTGVFGSTRILNGITVSPHNGLDIAAPLGTAIKAMTTGVVALTGDYYYNGKFVLLDHGGGLSSIYIHMSKLSVEKGDYILKGEKIGEVGSTGRSTGNHLHWGVDWEDKRIDPELITNMDDVFLKIVVK
ncbi:MAG: M23 family metallopeptidase [Candidatus Cloacimonetes bacterium]|nr:M23 family metallopeptidase [Candidatus Cloacimonadota bacterium]